MQFEEKEIELARAYLNGELTDVQFNYRLVQNNIDKKRIEILLEEISRYDPISTIVKLLLIYILFNFIFCIFCSWFRF